MCVGRTLHLLRLIALALARMCVGGEFEYQSCVIGWLFLFCPILFCNMDFSNKIQIIQIAIIGNQKMFK